MDTVSGGPIGLFVTVYLWFFLGIFILVGVVHVTNRWLGAGVILAGVVIESAAIAAVQAIAPAPLRFGPGIVAVVVVELIQAAATGMILLWCIGRLFGRWETVTTWVADYLEERRMKW